MARAPTNKELAEYVAKQLSPMQRAALLIRLLIRVLVPLAKNARAADDNLVALAFGVAAYSYSSVLEGQLSRSEYLRFRGLVQRFLQQQHNSHIAGRVAFVLDYFIEAAQLGFIDRGAVRRAFGAFLDLDPRLSLSIQADLDVWEGSTDWQATEMLSEPVQSLGRRLPMEEVDDIVLARGSNWSAWNQWLRARLESTDLGPDSARFFATIPAVLWPNAVKVNTWLVNGLPPVESERLSEATRVVQREPDENDIDNQEVASVSFLVTGDGQVHLDSAAGQQSLHDEQLNNDLHYELIEKVVRLQEVCGSSNSLAALAVSITKFHGSLGHSPLTLLPGPAIVRGNALRQDLKIDQRRRDALDPDYPPLPEGIAGLLEDLCETWNIYVGCDPFLDKIDRQRLGPEDKHGVELGFDEHNRVIDSAERDELATADAISILRETQAVAQNTSVAADRALAFLLRTMRNFARSVFRVALRHKGKIVTGFGALRFAHDHADYLRKLLANYPNLISILDWLLDATRLS